MPIVPGITHGEIYVNAGTIHSTCASQDKYDVWFSFEIPAYSNAIINVSADNNSYVTASVYDACGGNSLTCSFDSVHPGEEYVYQQNAGATPISRILRIGGFTSLDYTINYIVAPFLANEECANATPLTEGSTPGTNLGVRGTGFSACNQTEAMDASDVWYSFTIPANTQARLGILPEWTRMYADVYEACGGNGLACADAYYLFGMEYMVVDNYQESAVTHVLRVSTYPSSTGNFTLDLSFTPYPAPSNDECLAAKVIDTDTHLENNIGATSSSLAACAPAATNDVWYRFTVPARKVATINTDSNYFGLVTSLFNDCGAAESVCSTSGQFTVPNDTGTDAEYYLRVAGDNGARGEYLLWMFLTAIVNPEGEAEGAACVASPYPPDDPCYQETIATDSVCCDQEWDGICQQFYDLFCTPEGEGSVDGEGSAEGVSDGEGTADGEGSVEGVSDGEGGVDGEGSVEGGSDGEGRADGEGIAEGEGMVDGEGIAEGEGEGIKEGEDGIQTSDQNGDFQIALAELLRVIQLYNAGAFHCAENPGDTEDGYLPGTGADQTCTAYDTDYSPQNWVISLSELLRIIQYYNFGGYTYCPLSGSEDGYCPGLA